MFTRGCAKDAARPGGVNCGYGESRFALERAAVVNTHPSPIYSVYLQVRPFVEVKESRLLHGDVFLAIFKSRLSNDDSTYDLLPIRIKITRYCLMDGPVFVIAKNVISALREEWKHNGGENKIQIKN